MNGKSAKVLNTVELRKKAEKRARSNAAWLKQNDPEVLSPLALRSVLHELHIHQIELEMQNEELRRSHVELDAARTRYFDLFDLAPVGYFTIDDKGLVLEANLTGANLLGLTRTELVGQPFSRFIAYEDQDVYYLHRKKLLETGEHQICELRMTRKNQPAVLWVHLEASLVAAPGGGQVCRAVSTDISTLKDIQATLDRKLKEERLLLSETQHRIKNNVVSIISLLSMQARNTIYPEVLATLQETISRLRLMAELYDKMLLAGHSGEMEAGIYLGDLADSIVELFSGETAIKAAKTFDATVLDSDKLFSLGIIVNELMTNSIKHAFPGMKEGEITLSAARVDGQFKLSLHDNGRGLPEGFTPEGSTGFGLKLVRLLSEQLGGTFSIGNAEGTLSTVEFSCLPQGA
jgi:PAS domain S-box-containing protein